MNAKITDMLLVVAAIIAGSYIYNNYVKGR